MAKYSDEVRADVIADLLLGGSPTEISERLGIPRGTIRSWNHRLKNKPVAIVATDKSEGIGDLLHGYLEQMLITLKSQLVVMSNQDWIKRQKAADLAILFGMIAERANATLLQFGETDETDDQDTQV